jgi:hypothetical protein
VTLGALNLLSVTRAPMAEADLIVARAFADLAALSIAQHRAGAEAQHLNEQLSGALTSREVPCFDDVGGEQLARSGTNVHRVVRRAGRHEEGITACKVRAGCPWIIICTVLARMDVQRPGVAVEQRLECAGLQVGAPN